MHPIEPVLSDNVMEGYSENQPSKGNRSHRSDPAQPKGALKKEGRAAASHKAISRQAHATARRRSPSARAAAAQKAARTRGRQRSR